MADIRSEPLTEREREILTFLVERWSNQEIAARLHLALRTVKWYNSQIYSKLGVKTRREAVERAQSLGLLKAVADTQAFTLRNNLPLQPTRFVGRQHELASIANQLTDTSTMLVTILAPGGMGKTRLALAVAERELRHFRDGVFFVPLVALTSTDEIITAIADNVGFSFYGSAPPQRQLLDYFRERRMLLILDNFEHLLEGALLVADILQTAPGLRVLITSRERLNLQGETVYILRGLDFPTSPTLEQLQDYDAVKLFILSVQRIRPGFEIQAGDLGQMARICQLTAGMPLAIELAAGWLDTLSLEHIVHELQQGIDILETDMRDLPERHRSVRATFERTWNRLTDEEQGAFRRLSIFSGGFSLAAAEAVAGASPRYLRGLAQKALIQTERNERFTIHELLRQFGADKLAETAEWSPTRAKHAAFFADFMQARQSEIFTRQQFIALDQIGVDFENIRSAWNMLVNEQAFAELPKFLNGFQFFFNVRNRWQEAIDLFETTANSLQLLPVSDVTELALARVWGRLAWFYGYIGFSEKGKTTAEAAIQRFAQHDSPEELIVAYRHLALIFMLLKDSETQRRMAQAGYALALKLGHRSHEAYCLIQLSLAAIGLNHEMDIALRTVRQARTIQEDLGDQWGMMMSYITEAGGSFQIGDYQQAGRLLTKGRAIAETFGTAYYTASVILYLGIVTLHQEDYSQAWDLLSQSLRIFWDAGYTHFAHAPLIRTAQLLLHIDKTEAAAELLALTERYPGSHGHGAMFEMNADGIEKFRRELESRLGADRFVAAWVRGTQRELSAVVAEILSGDLDE